MNKKQLIKSVATQANKTQKEVNIILSLAFDVMVGELKTGNSVRLAGFGNFITKDSIKRNIRNINTGRITQVITKQSAIFKPSNTLKKQINKNENN